jgi:protease I
MVFETRVAGKAGVTGSEPSVQGRCGMDKVLEGRRIAFFASPEGTEQVELTVPWERLTQAGATCELISLEPGEIRMFHNLDRGDPWPVDRILADAEASEFDGLVLPGGVANPDHARMLPEAVRFVRSFFDQNKPVAAICHAPWLLIEADVVSGRSLTSWPSLRTDIHNAGGSWVDREVVRQDNLVTSRKPDDLPAFCAAAIELFASSRPRGPERRSA